MIALLALLLVPPVRMLAGGGTTTPEMGRRFLTEIGGPQTPIAVLALVREAPEVNSPKSADSLREVGRSG